MPGSPTPKLRIRETWRGHFEVAEYRGRYWHQSVGYFETRAEAEQVVQRIEAGEIDTAGNVVGEARQMATQAKKRKPSPRPATPGPWKVGDLSGEVIDAQGNGIAAPVDCYDEAQWEADSRLIAAAPDLLEAVAPIASIALTVMTMEQLTQITVRVRAAIAKATGEGR